MFWAHSFWHTYNPNKYNFRFLKVVDVALQFAKLQSFPPVKLSAYYIYLNSFYSLKQFMSDAQIYKA